ncbi:MAG: SDR family oxidoreductase [Bacteroidota bacterium]
MSRPFFSDRTALVTGASSGIGAAFARQLGSAGARVVLVARRAEALASVADDVRQRGGEAVVLTADLEPAGAAADLASRLDADGETIDVLINNAGFGIRGPMLDSEPSQSEAMIGLNVTSLTSLTHRLVPGMAARQRGGVLNVASIASFVPAPSFAVYAATKAYVRSFTEALWSEMRETGVHVSCLCPGPVDTSFGDRAGVRAEFFRGHPSAEAVAQAGLDGLASNRRLVVPGWKNRLDVATASLAPTGVALRIAKSRMEAAGY